MMVQRHETSISEAEQPTLTDLVAEIGSSRIALDPDSVFDFHLISTDGECIHKVKI